MVKFDELFVSLGLDKKDRQIIYELNRNARQSNSSIAKKLRLDKNVVNYRINKLIERKIITGFYTVVDSIRLGKIPIRLYIKLQYTTPAIEKKIFNFISKNEMTLWLSEISGIYDLGCVMWTKNMQEYNKFYFEFMKKFQKYMQRRVMAVYIGFHDCGYAFFSPEKLEERMIFHIGEKPGNFSLSKGEERVLSAIVADARLPTVEIAEKTGMSPQGVKYTIKNLKEKGIIRGFRANINLEKMGLTVYKINVFLKDLEKYDEMVEWGCSKPYLAYINQVVGYADFEAEIVALSHKEVDKFLQELRAKFPDKIRDWEYFVHKEIVTLRYF